MNEHENNILIRDAKEFISSASFLWPAYMVQSAWHQHAPFAFWIVEALKPNNIVELGTHNGFSYLTFCQSVQQFELDTQCYAIDTWQGDEHAGFYNEDVYKDLADYHNPRYNTFSRLVRSTFDDAVKHFPDGSIDLLHIDGRHFYDDVKHDFETWQHKLSDQAVVLFHDTNVRERGFGVFQYWIELREEYPGFEFLHGHGLGVLGVGDAVPLKVAALFAAASNPRLSGQIRTMYARLGQAVDERHRVARLEAELNAKQQAAREAKKNAETARQELLAAQTKLSQLERRTQSSRWLFRQAWSKIIHAPRDMSRRIGRSWRKRGNGRWAALKRLRDKRYRKFASGRLILNLEPLLPRRIAARIRRRVDKNTPWDAYGHPGRNISHLLANKDYKTALFEIEHISGCLLDQHPELERWVRGAHGVALLRLGRLIEAETLFAHYYEQMTSDTQFALQPSFRGDYRTHGNLVFSFTEKKRPKETETQHFCVYTALFDDYDSLPSISHLQTNVKFICFSDKKHDASGWDFRIVKSPYRNGRLANRYFKLFPHTLIPEYDASIYVDANVQFTIPPERLWEDYLAGEQFVGFSHPERDDIMDEFEAILLGGRHCPSDIFRQIFALQQHGIPRHTGLLEACFLWRNHTNPAVCQLMELWWDFISKHGGRDQPSLAYLMWKTGVRPAVIPMHVGSSRRNKVFFKRPHVRRQSTSDSQKGCVKGTARFRATPHVTWIYSTQHANVGSTLMRVFQLSEIAERTIGDVAKISVVDHSHLNLIKRSAVVLSKEALKIIKSTDILKLQRNHCLVFADYVDGLMRSDIDEVVDGFIASSIAQKLYLEKNYSNKRVHYVIHHCDPRLPGPSSPNSLKIGYFGELVNAKYVGELQGYIDFHAVDTKKSGAEWLKPIAEYSAHYAVRAHREIDGFKPFLKGFTAAMCDANILVHDGESDSVHYLGDDYPYLLRDDDLQSILDMIDHMKATFGSPMWQSGLDRVRAIKNELSDENIGKKLRKLIA